MSFEVLELGFEKTAGQYFVISNFFPPRYQGKKSRSKDTVFTTCRCLPLCIFLPSFLSLNILSCATARARSAKETEQDWECSKV